MSPWFFIVSIGKPRLATLYLAALKKTPAGMSVSPYLRKVTADSDAGAIPSGVSTL